MLPAQKGAKRGAFWGPREEPNFSIRVRGGPPGGTLHAAWRAHESLLKTGCEILHAALQYGMAITIFQALK